MKATFVLSTVFALAVAGCGGSSPSPAAAPSGPRSSASPAAPSLTTATDALTGTWQTAPLPTAPYVATYRKAGATPSALRQFRDALSGLGHKHRYVIHIADGHWVLLEQHDGGTAQLSWSGTYTLTGHTVHATETETGCRLTYLTTVNGTSLRIRLLSETTSPQCPHTDTWPQRSIYETTAFHRTS